MADIHTEMAKRGIPNPNESTGEIVPEPVAEDKTMEQGTVIIPDAKGHGREDLPSVMVGDIGDGPEGRRAIVKNPKITLKEAGVGRVSSQEQLLADAKRALDEIQE